MATKLHSPLPWTKDELNNIYDATGRMIFKACAFEELREGVMLENEGNADLVVSMTNVAHLLG